MNQVTNRRCHVNFQFISFVYSKFQVILLRYNRIFRMLVVLSRMRLELERLSVKRVT